MKRRRKTTEDPAAALARIQSMQFGGNDVLVINAFADCGIDPERIDPRHNVLTFNAWKAKGRRVGKGAISQRVTVWIPTGKDEPAEPPKDGERPKRSGMRPTTARLFHESQTVPADAEKGTRPVAWENPKLVREGTYQPETETAEPATDDAEATLVLSAGFAASVEEKARSAREREVAGDCSCPMVGVITNVDCPIHGEMVTA